MPQNAFQIYISDSGSDLPDLLKAASDTFRGCFSSYSYTLYDKETLGSFISNEIGSEAFNAYKKLKPYAYKADLGRYCVAFIKGGWYADITIKMQIPCQVNVNRNIEMLYFRDLGNANVLPYGVQTSLFYTKPGNPVFQKAIDLVVENCRNEYYGDCDLSPTGPGVFGRAIAIYGHNANQIVGEFMPLTPQYPRKNRAYILPEGKIFAIHKDAWLSDTQLVELFDSEMNGYNSYTEMHHQKSIYDVSIAI